MSQRKARLRRRAISEMSDPKDSSPPPTLNISRSAIGVLTFAQRFAISLIRHGRMPAHVAFIMDGNRRFGKKHGLDKNEAYKRGFNKFVEVVKWCAILGIPTLTVYAFSIENFRRSSREVNDLFGIFEERMDYLIKELSAKSPDLAKARSVLDEQGYKLKFCGELSMLPPTLRQKVEKLEYMCNSHHDCCVDPCKESPNEQKKVICINVCLSYTSSNEAARVFERMKSQDDVSEETIERRFNENSDFAHCSDPDIILRTSHAQRLSDFLLFQGRFAFMAFVKPVWPDLTIWNFLWTIINYQICSKVLEVNKRIADGTK